jgi:hypothetical protein
MDKDGKRDGYEILVHPGTPKGEGYFFENFRRESKLEFFSATL